MPAPLAVVSLLNIPPGHPFTAAVQWMLGLTAAAVVISVANFVMNFRSNRRKMDYLRRADEMLLLVKARVLQTIEHRDEAEKAQQKAIEQTAAVKDVVEKKGEEIVQAVQQAVQQAVANPADGPGAKS